jgi:hypothetical protein
MTTTTLAVPSRSSFRLVLSLVLLLLGAFVAFLASLVIASLMLPLSEKLVAATPPSGFLPMGAAMVFNAAVNALLLIWAARRSSQRGFALVAQLAVLSFGAQVFMTQVETAYFIAAFPLLHGNFQLYVLVLRGLVTSVLFSFLVALLTGGFGKAPRPQTCFKITVGAAVRAVAWLPVVYIGLYLLFGYYVAWQSPEVRFFYGGPAELNSFSAQWAQTFMDRPEIPVFQYFRGVLWILCLVPLIGAFSGNRWEVVALSALALGFLPTAQLAFANPLMPAAVSLAHFWEVSISTGLFGGLVAWVLTRPETNVAAAPRD